MDDANLIREVLAFVSAKSWEQWEAMIRINEGSLMSDDADRLLDDMLKETKEGDELRTIIELRRALLRRCREQGIDAAFAHLKGPVGDGEEAATASTKKRLDEMQQMIEASDPEETMMHPDMYRGVVLRGALKNYDTLLETQKDSPLDYTQTQLTRARILHQLSSLRGEDRAKRLLAALEAYTDSLQRQQNSPRDLAVTQSNRATVFYQLAMLPGENHTERLQQALEAYALALKNLESNPHLYIRTQLARVALLRDMAGLPGEHRGERLRAALDGFNRVIALQEEDPIGFAQTQLPRANLLRELAGLAGEPRAVRLYEALGAYNEVLRRLPPDAAEVPQVQIKRSSLLQEIGGLPGENATERSMQSLNAAVQAFKLLENQPDSGGLRRTAQRMLNNIRKLVIDTKDERTFNLWWEQIAAIPQPEWLGNPEKMSG